MSIDDIYRSHRPRAFVKIGGSLILCESFNLTKSNKGEAQSANATILLDSIESDVFADDKIMDNIMEIEIWAGYVEDVKHEAKQLEDIKEDILSKNPKNRLFTRRFSGFVSQPDWSFGGDGEYLHLACLDWTDFLRQFKYAENFEGSACEIREIAKKITAAIKGINIIVDDYSGSARLGEITTDGKTTTQVYHAAGKDFMAILDDCADKLGYIIIVNGKDIHLTAQKKSPFIWPMYYGPANRQELIQGQPRGQYFDTLNFRFGAKGRTEKSNVVVEVTGINYNKKGTNGKPVRVVFPEDKAITSVTKYEKIQVAGDVRESQLKIIAENRYRQLASRLVTGTISLPFANNFIELWDIVEFVPDESKESLKFLKGYWFNVAAINEDFGSDGYSQSVEFESDVTLQKTVKRKIAPQPPKKK
jgi:hypothetical protein